jgi:hypothetical protein
MARQVSDAVNFFHEKMVDTMQLSNKLAELKNAVDMQHMSEQAKFRELCRTMTVDLSNAQKDINRGFAPKILDAMKPAYELCNQEKGKNRFYPIELRPKKYKVKAREIDEKILSPTTFLKMAKQCFKPAATTSKNSLRN